MPWRHPPEIGDKESGNLPVAYGQLGRAVAPLRSDIPEAWFKAPECDVAPSDFTSKSGRGDAEPEQLPPRRHLKTWLARLD